MYILNSISFIRLVFSHEIFHRNGSFGASLAFPHEVLGDLSHRRHRSQKGECKEAIPFEACLDGNMHNNIEEEIEYVKSRSGLRGSPRKLGDGDEEYDYWRKRAGWFDDDVSMQEYNNGVYNTYYDMDDSVSSSGGGRVGGAARINWGHLLLKATVVAIAIALAILLFRTLTNRRSSSSKESSPDKKSSSRKGRSDSSARSRRSRSKSTSSRRSSRSKSRSRKTDDSYKLMEDDDGNSRKSSRSGRSRSRSVRRSRSRSRGSSRSKSRSKRREESETREIKEVLV